MEETLMAAITANVRKPDAAGAVLNFLGLAPKINARLEIWGGDYEKGYQFFAERAARLRGICGRLEFTSNDIGAFFAMEVQGTRYTISKLIEDLQKGPTYPRFRIDVQWKPYKQEYYDFRISL